MDQIPEDAGKDVVRAKVREIVEWIQGQEGKEPDYSKALEWIREHEKNGVPSGFIQTEPVSLKPYVLTTTHPRPANPHYGEDDLTYDQSKGMWRYYAPSGETHFYSERNLPESLRALAGLPTQDSVASEE